MLLVHWALFGDIARRQHLRSAGCRRLLVPLDVRSSGLFYGRPDGLELVTTRLRSKSDAFC